jgi:hemerythrin superfamily protein
MDVIDVLTEDHRRVNELFRRVQIAEKAETIDEITKEIVHELSVHAAVEEQFVYPLVRVTVDDGGDTADHAIEEHAEAKRLLADLEKQDAGSTEHRTTMDQLIDSVRHHVEEEENEMFAQLRESTDAGTREKVGTIVEQAKAVVPTHPHPLVPGNATAQLIAGPWATAVDKARDLLSA